MDRIEKPKKPSEFANEREVSQGDAAILATPTGRDIDQSARPATPRSAVTGRHDAGSGANENDDGEDALTAELRHAAEDTPTGDDRKEDVPVFDRAGAAPKI